MAKQEHESDTSGSEYRRMSRNIVLAEYIYLVTCGCNALGIITPDVFRKASWNVSRDLIKSAYPSVYPCDLYVALAGYSNSLQGKLSLVTDCCPCHLCDSA